MLTVIVLPEVSDVDRVTEVVVVCPAELSAAIPARPVLPADAVVTANAPGGAWLSEELGWGSTLQAVLADATAACRAATGTAEPPGVP